MNVITAAKLSARLARAAPIAVLCAIAFGSLAMARFQPAADSWLLERFDMGFDMLAALAFVALASYTGTRLALPRTRPYIVDPDLIPSLEDVEQILRQQSGPIMPVRPVRTFAEQFQQRIDEAAGNTHTAPAASVRPPGPDQSAGSGGD